MKELHKDLGNELQATTKLFIEYLVHEEGINYNRIAAAASCHHSQVYHHSFNNEVAYKICKAFKFYIRGFDEYYGWVKPKDDKVNFNI